MNLLEISKTEDQFVNEAGEIYGKYFAHAQFALDYLHTSIKSTSYEGAFFLMFFASVEKHIVLRALSGARLHHVQANFDYRYATEAGRWAAYALAHPDPKKFADTKEDGTLEPTKKLKKEMYDWLEKHYPAGNESIKRFKNTINSLSTHANIVDAHRQFGDFGKEKIGIEFFDKQEHHHVITDLWTAANLTMGLLDLFYGVNKDHAQLVFHDDFLERMAKLRKENDDIKAEMMQHPRIKVHAKK